MTYDAVLITGASHTGKSTLARCVSESLGWRLVATDSLARHPGRPWPDPKPHVREFFKELSDDTVFVLLEQHYDAMQPAIRAALRRRPVVIEGSAIRPGRGIMDGCLGICLTVSETRLTERLRAESGYAERAAEDRGLIDAFLRRSLKDDGRLTRLAIEHNWRVAENNTEDTAHDFCKWVTNTCSNYDI